MRIDTHVASLAGGMRGPRSSRGTGAPSSSMVDDCGVDKVDRKRRMRSCRLVQEMRYDFEPLKSRSDNHKKQVEESRRILSAKAKKVLF